MRRKDREITDKNAIVEVMRRCEVCHVAFHGEEFPYVVPMLFGMEERDGEITLYFHGAKTGRKHDLLGKNNKVAFVMEQTRGLVTGPRVGPCECTMEFDSVMGTGVMDYAPPEEKIPALRALLRQYDVTEGPDYAFQESVLPRTTILRLRVLSLSGKRRDVASQKYAPHR